MRKFIQLLSVIALLSSCGEYQSVLKTDDTDLMYQKAIEFYNKGEYGHCVNLLDRVKMYSYSLGGKRAQSIAYYRAYATYGKGLYENAAELFRQFIATYPESPYYEECLYMVGYCNYKESPRPRLDQGPTLAALQYFQVYLDRYPNSLRKSYINDYVVEMQDKIAYKAFLGASNYYQRGRYKSAVVSLRNCIEDYPGSKYREEVLNMLFNAKYYLAVNSVPDKQLERYYDAQEEYGYFMEEFPESRFASDMQKKYSSIEDFLKNYKFAN